MATLSELINAVADDVNRSDMTSNCSDAVVLAIRHYDRKSWWFQEGSATFSTTASVELYPLASNFREMEYVEAKYPGDNWQEVVRCDFPSLKRKLQGVTVTGYPDEYAIYDNALYLGYAPNGSYQVRYYYNKTLTDLTANASNAWTTDGEELIRARAAKKVAMDVLHDAELAGLFEASERDALNSLTDENERRTTTGKITPKY